LIDLQKILGIQTLTPKPLHPNLVTLNPTPYVIFIQNWAFREGEREQLLVHMRSRSSLTAFLRTRWDLGIMAHDHTYFPRDCYAERFGWRPFERALMLVDPKEHFFVFG